MLYKFFYVSIIFLLFKRVYDEDTGRVRLVKGSGEILEECVSRERQQAINKQVCVLVNFQINNKQQSNNKVNKQII